MFIEVKMVLKKEMQKYYKLVSLMVGKQELGFLKIQVVQESLYPIILLRCYQDLQWLVIRLLEIKRLELNLLQYKLMLKMLV